MNRWAVYNQQGRINSIYSGPNFEAQQQARGGLQVLPIADYLDDVTAYISDGAVQPKAAFPFVVSAGQITANGTDEAIISGIPSDVQVRWPDGQVDTVTDGEVGFKVDLPGNYTFRFTAVPYLDQEVTIEAVAAT